MLAVIGIARPLLAESQVNMAIDARWRRRWSPPSLASLATGEQAVDIVGNVRPHPVGRPCDVRAAVVSAFAAGLARVPSLAFLAMVK